MTTDTLSPLGRHSEEYWNQTRQPLLCMVFLFPLLAAYEIGVLMVGGDDANAIRNGADFWMRDWLRIIGLDYALLLPGLVLAGLLVWHIVGRYPWRLPIETLAGMLAESLIFAFVLVIFGQLTDYLFRHAEAAASLSVPAQTDVLRAITFLGAGVYEEFMFRLCLLPICYGLFRLLRLEPKWSAGLSILATSLVFSLAHYVGPSADTLVLFTFTFRALAGAFFAALFVVRGFGITVGCHAAYDLLVGILLRNG
jgi:membrane protease YdiL (CAAX protease family)